MKLSITIEVDDAAPNIELCGKNCKYLAKGICQLFGEQLTDFGHNKIDDFDETTIVYDKTQIIHAWYRSKKCVEFFYKK